MPERLGDDAVAYRLRLGLLEPLAACALRCDDQEPGGYQAHGMAHVNKKAKG